MRQFWLLGASIFVIAAAPATLAPDAKCLYEAIDPQLRPAIGTSMATGAAAGDAADLSLAQAMKSCAATWPQARTEAAITYAGSRMMFEWAGTLLAAAKVDPALVIQWFDAQPADRRNSLFAKDGDEAADTAAMGEIVIFLRSKGVDEAIIGANMEPLGHALAALVIGARMKAGLPL